MLTRTLTLALALVCSTAHAELQPIAKPRMVKQKTDSDCGQACVAMIANITLEQAYDCYGHRSTTWPSETASVLRKMGFRVRVFTTRYIGERHFWKCNGIAILKAPDGGIGHCQVWFDGKILDPDSEVSRWPVERFIEVLGKEP